jgi:hypothetical protein
MKGYQRFLPRHATRTTAHTVAEAAEPAEDQASQRSGVAEALLKPAEVRSGHRRLQQASAEVQRRQTAAIPKLQQLQQLQREPAQGIDQKLGECPSEWLEGVARLATVAPPRSYPAHAWQQLITDAARFLDDWAQQAAVFGWPAWELFGCHRRAPWGRIQGMGLLLLLRGDDIAALTATEALIRTQTGARQTYCRKPSDPLHPAERCLVWELA